MLELREALVALVCSLTITPWRTQPTAVTDPEENRHLRPRCVFLEDLQRPRGVREVVFRVETLEENVLVASRIKARAPARDRGQVPTPSARPNTTDQDACQRWEWAWEDHLSQQNSSLTRAHKGAAVSPHRHAHTGTAGRSILVLSSCELTAIALPHGSACWNYFVFAVSANSELLLHRPQQQDWENTLVAPSKGSPQAYPHHTTERGSLSDSSNRTLHEFVVAVRQFEPFSCSQLQQTPISLTQRPRRQIGKTTRHNRARPPGFVEMV